MKEYQIKQGATTVIIEAESNEQAIDIAIGQGLIKPTRTGSVMSLFGGDIKRGLVAEEAQPVGFGSEAP